MHVWCSLLTLDRTWYVDLNPFINLIKKSNGIKSHNLCGQSMSTFWDITRLGNLVSCKVSVSYVVRHVILLKSNVIQIYIIGFIARKVVHSVYCFFFNRMWIFTISEATILSLYKAIQFFFKSIVNFDRYMAFLVVHYEFAKIQTSNFHRTQMACNSNPKASNRSPFWNLRK